MALPWQPQLLTTTTMLYFKINLITYSKLNELKKTFMKYSEMTEIWSEKKEFNT